MIQLEGLSHEYQRGKRALDDVGLTIGDGQCFGLIGSNGAGKTTTMRILATLVAPTAGRASIAGKDVVTDYLAVRRKLGYMPEAFSVYQELTVEEFLYYTAAAYGFRGDERKRKVDAVIALTDLDGKRKDGCGTLSRGMQQRLFLARALVHDPPVLLLDEPTAALDPAARIEFRQIMKALTAAGKTTVVSSHILPELSEFCTSIGIIERGKLVASGSLDEVRRQVAGPIEVQVDVAADASAVATVLRGRPGIADVRVDGRRAIVRCLGPRESLPDLLRVLVEAGVPVAAFGERHSTLEDIFMKVAAFEVG